MKITGRIIKTYGFEGAVVIRSEGGITVEPKKGEPVFVVIDGIPVPFFTREAYSPTTDTLIISFDDYLTAESVSALKGCEILTPEVEDDKNNLADIIGFTITDSTSRLTAIITDVVQNPGQSLLIAETESGEILVPFHPDLIISLNKKKKIIEMRLPEGLTGING